jgi:phage FluMu protein Com
MPYLRCPSCALLTHAVGAVAVNCPRCRALQGPVELKPLGRSLQQVDGSLKHQSKPVR